jgi:hypothetical protein
VCAAFFFLRRRLSSSMAKLELELFQNAKRKKKSLE